MIPGMILTTTEPAEKHHCVYFVFLAKVLSEESSSVQSSTPTVADALPAPISTADKISNKTEFPSKIAVIKMESAQRAKKQISVEHPPNRLVKRLYKNLLHNNAIP